MNSKLHRTVYNEKTASWVAVAEISRSKGKAQSQTLSPELAVPSANATLRPDESLFALNAMPTALAGLGLSAVLSMGHGSAEAQIVADKRALAAQQATVLQSANGVPVVNITTPNAQGVSRNVYIQFDVSGKGLVMNNGRAMSQTELAGWVQANPWLATGGARVILNEINSSNPSQLNGYIEIAGQKADIVIANPSGIQVNGGGFINAGRATLTTGQTSIDAGNISYQVNQGSIQITGAGLDGRRADFTELITRAMNLNAGIWAQDLSVRAGANTSAADASSKPEFAIDASQLGGMYAGKISLIGNEAGVGVRNAGEISASARGVTITADGKLVNSGSMASNQASSDLNIQSTSLANSGSISSRNNLTISNSEPTQNSGLITAGRELKLSSQSIDNNKGTINAKRLDITAQTLSNTAGKIQQTGSQSLGFNTASLSNSQKGVVGSLADSSAVTPTPTPTGTTPTPSSTSTSTTPTAPSSTGAGGAAASVAPVASAETLAVGTLQIAGASDNQSGQITASGGMDLSTKQSLSNQSGASIKVQQLSATGASFNNDAGTIAATDVKVQVTGSISNQGGKINSLGAAKLDAQNLNNSQGQISAAKTLAVTTTQDILNTSGSLLSVGSVNLSGQNISSNKGLIASIEGGLTLIAGQNIDNSEATLQVGETASQDLQIQAQTLNNQAGKIVQLGAGKLTAALSGDVNNLAGRIAAQTALEINAQNLDNSQTASSSNDKGIQAKDVRINAGQLHNQSGSVKASNTAALSSSSLNNQSGSILANGDTTLTNRGALNNSQGKIETTGNLSITNAAALTNTGGSISANKNAAITSASLTGDGKINAGQNLSAKLQSDYNHQSGAEFSANGAASLQTTGAMSNQGKLSSKGSLNLTASSIDNQTGAEISSGQNTEMQASSNITNRGSIDGKNTILKAGDTVNNLGTGIILGDNIAIGASTLNNRADAANGVTTSASIAARKDLDIGVKTLNNEDGSLIYSGGDMYIGGSLDAQNHATGKADNVFNRSSTIDSNGNLALATKNLLNNNETFSTKVETTTKAKKADYITFANGRNYRVYADERYSIDNVGNYFKGDQPSYDHEGYAGPRDAYVRPSATYDFAKGYLKRTYMTRAIPGRESEFYGFYTNDNIVWSLFGVTAPKLVRPAVGSSGYAAWKKEFDAAFAQLIPKLFAYNADYLTRRGDIVTYIRIAEIQTTQTVVLNEGVQAKISSGGNMTLDVDAGLNSNSRITAGGTLSGNANINNKEEKGILIEESKGSFSNDYLDYDPYGFNYGEGGRGTYSKIEKNISIDVSKAVIQGNLNESVKRDQPSSAIKGITPISEIKTTQTSASGNALLANQGAMIRTSTPNLNLPNNSLFITNPASANNYLVETDPRFTNKRQFLSSDYMLSQLAYEPGSQIKRLGDGFYEQKLIRDQVAYLTGMRFLGDYSSDEEQYKALMNDGATFAKTQKLRPGVALTVEQVAQLTSDIVWMVEQEVTLPNGSKTKALVPQVYVKVKPGDIDGSGALLAGNNIDLKTGGNLDNSGTIAGRKIVALNANNVNNLGRITGQQVGLTAKEDINIIGGSVDASQKLVAVAGRDVNVTTTTRTASTLGDTISRTNIDRVAGLYVTGGTGGTLYVSADRDVNLNAALINNQSNSGLTVLNAKNDLNIQTVNTGHREDVTFMANNYRKESNSQDVGSQISGSGDILLKAGNDINAKAATVQAGGVLVADAGKDINIGVGESKRTLDQAFQRNESNFLSSKSKSGHDTENSTTALGSVFEGKQVGLSAKNDINITGSSVVSDTQTHLKAGHDVNIVAATNTSAETHVKDERNSGLMSSGGLGFTIGKKQQSSDAVQTSTTATGSTVASIAGNVNIEAGNRYNQVGSDVTTPKGDIDITAKKVDITEARETASSQVVEKSRQSGLTVSVGNAITNNAQSVAAMASAAQNTQSSRMQALAAATSALGIYNNAGDIAKAAADPIGTASVSVSVGSAKSDSSQSSTSNTAKGSNLTAGGNVNITATGAGKDSDITIQGSTVNAGGNVKLKADDTVNLQAARNQEQTQSNNSSSSASLGVSYAVQSGGLGFNIAASKGNGNGDGNSTSYTNTSVNAGNKLTIESGGDTNLLGATASGKSVVTKVGGNLNIESLQDTSTYAENQKNSGASLSLSAAGVPTGGSISAGRTNINSNYQSVGTQSRILAGDGGFQVEVKGDTTLKGGAITSTQVAIDSNKNSFQTGGVLSLTDLENKAAYEAKSTGVTLGSGAGAGVGRASGDATSTTTAGISGVAGNTAARTGDAQTGIKPIFDKDAVKADVQAQVQITTAFGQQAPKAVADAMVTKVDELKTQAKNEADPIKKQALLEDAAKWDEGGAYRVVAQTAIGALGGGVGGAIGAGTLAMAAEQLDTLQSNMQSGLEKAGMSLAAAKATATMLAQGVATGLGAGVGGTTGAAAGLNVDANNRQLHPSEYQRARDLANNKQLRDALSKNEGREITASELEGRLAAEMLRNSDATVNAQNGGVHDYNLRATVGCQLLNCKTSETDPNYSNADYNTQFISPNQSTYNKGQSQLNSGVTYNQLVTNNIENNPVSTSLAGAGMVALGVVVGGPATLGARLVTGGIGLGANAVYQSTTSEPFDFVDASIAGATGLITGGGGLIPGLASSLGVNTGGALIGSTLKGENPNGTVGGAVIGTVVGYGIGKSAESIIKVNTVPWYRPDWVNTGVLGIQRWNTPSPIPTIGGNVISSGAQESLGDAIKNKINKKMGQ